MTQTKEEFVDGRRGYMSSQRYEQEGREETKRELENLAEKIRQNPKIAEKATAYRSRLETVDHEFMIGFDFAIFLATIASIMLYRIDDQRENRYSGVDLFFKRTGPDVLTFLMKFFLKPVPLVGIISITFVCWLVSLIFESRRYMLQNSVSGPIIDNAFAYLFLTTSVAVILTVTIFFFGDRVSVPEFSKMFFSALETHKITNLLITGPVLVTISFATLLEISNDTVIACTSLIFVIFIWMTILRTFMSRDIVRKILSVIMIIVVIKLSYFGENGNHQFQAHIMICLIALIDIIAALSDYFHRSTWKRHMKNVDGNEIEEPLKPENR